MILDLQKPPPPSSQGELAGTPPEMSPPALPGDPRAPMESSPGFPRRCPHPLSPEIPGRTPQDSRISQTAFPELLHGVGGSGEATENIEILKYILYVIQLKIIVFEYFKYVFFT